MVHLEELYWQNQPFLTFAILIAGGLISLAIYSRDEPLSSSTSVGPAENAQDGDSATH